jgi:hypothetical protein
MYSATSRKATNPSEWYTAGRGDRPPPPRPIAPCGHGGDPVIPGFRRICPRSVPPVVRGDLRDSLSLHPRACQRVTKEATCLPWVAHPHWRMRGSWWLREGVAAATLDQYTTLARNSCRRAVSVTHTDQSAGHAKPWNHAFKAFFHIYFTLCKLFV